MNRRSFLNLNVGDIVICKRRKARVISIDKSYGLVKIQYLDTKRQQIKGYKKNKGGAR